jgi:hypothetical protein
VVYDVDMPFTSIPWPATRRLFRRQSRKWLGISVTVFAAEFVVAALLTPWAK